MDIRTQKEVFSEGSTAPAPKRRGRPRKNPVTSGGTSNQPAHGTPESSATSANSAATPAQSGQALTDSSDANSASNRPKTVFYQAAKPRQASSFRRAPGIPPTGPDQGNGNGSPQPPLPHANGGRPFAERPRHDAGPNRGNRSFSSNPTARAIQNARTNRYPQDAAGTFMTPVSARPSNTIGAGDFVRSGTANLKIIPLGGLEEIGKNMTVFEYGQDIFIVDMGLMFPDYDMFGVDYIIPDVTYLQDKKDRIRGVFITHGHLDHIGAIPYLIEKIGFPPIYGTQVTIGMVKQRMEEFGLLGRNRLVVVEADKDVIQLGAFKVFAFHLVHSIPGAVGLEITCPNGRIVLATDWKFDYTPAGGRPVDFQTLAAIGARGVDLLLSDSTNAEKPGHSISERVVEQSLATAVEEAQGRVIIAMFASNINRIQQALDVAARFNRKVLIVGRSMQQNVEMAVSLKAIVVPPNTLIGEREAARFAENQLMILSTGSQGEDRSALVRMANGEHKTIKIKKGDTVVISASPIPGNERSVNIVMDVLYKAGAQVIYNKILDVHSSGHAYAEDLKLFLALMKPRYFVPLHGTRSKLIVHGHLAEEVGVAKESIMIGENGLIFEMTPQSTLIQTESKVPSGYVMVDGLGVGDVGSIVLRDRQAMAQDGIFVAISVFEKKAKRFATSPDIISRGFIYMRENEQFVNDIRNEIKRFLNHAVEANKNVDLGQVRQELRDHISKLLYEKTERTPMVIPVIIEV